MGKAICLKWLPSEPSEICPFFLLPFKTRLRGIKIRKIALWMSASGRAMGEIWWLRPGDESGVKKNVWLKNIGLFYLQNLCSQHTAAKQHAPSWFMQYQHTKYTFCFIHVNCFQVCTSNEIFIAIFIVYVCRCICSYTAIMKLKWDSKESLSWVMQMMIIEMWCVAITSVVAAFVCKFNIPLLLCLKINI